MSTLLILSIVLTIFASPSLAATPLGYTNHTVGGTTGWLFNSTTNSSATNYTAWAAPLSFNLGDYLIFNTNSNMTLVQTYNETTYSLCSADQDDNSTMTSVYSDDGNDGFGIAEVLAVPLTMEGANYYFSDAGDDTVQCVRASAPRGNCPSQTVPAGTVFENASCNAPILPANHPGRPGNQAGIACFQRRPIAGSHHT